jgi:hypothetical protein
MDLTVPPTSPNNLPICSFPRANAPFGKVDLRVVCEEIQEASPVGGNPCVVESLQIFERNRLSLLVRHCVFGECHRRFPTESCHEQRNEPALGTNFLAVILYSPIQQPLALARLASQALGRLWHERREREREDQADRWALSN